MKVRITDKEIHSYSLDVEVEVEGKRDRVKIYYDPQDGYELLFFDSMGRVGERPQWAIDYEQESDSWHSLGYWLEEQASGRWVWTDKEEVNV